MPLRNLLLFLFFLTTTLLHGQSPIGDFSLSDTTNAWFDTAIGIDDSELMTGVYYDLQIRSRTTHPMLIGKNWSEGSLVYRGLSFQNVDLIYDTYTDVLVTHRHDDLSLYSQLISLNKEQVKSFELEGRQFKRLTDMPLYPNGYFEMFCDSDDFSFVSKRVKHLDLDGQEMLYKTLDLFFIKKHGMYYKVTGKKSVIKTFPEDERELSTFLKVHKISKLKNASVGQLSDLGIFCNELMTKH